MNLTLKEIISSVALIIKNDPVTEISIDNGSIELVHMSKKREKIDIPFVRNEIIETHETHHDHKVEDKEILFVVESYLKSLPKEDNDFEFDYDKILEQLKNDLQSKEDNTPITVKEEYDDSDIKSLIYEIASKLTNQIDEIKDEIKDIDRSPVVVNEREVDLSFYDNEFKDVYDRINDIENKATEENNNKKDYIVDIVTRLASIYLVYNSGFERDVTNMFESSVTVYGGGGGGGGGRGASAYEIAVNNGFQGTEQQWLDSLQGDASVTQQDGVINYDVQGRVESVVVGSITTTFSRTEDGSIESISKPTYDKVFIRDNEGVIVGWNVINK
jgi:hypothetical protein